MKSKNNARGLIARAPLATAIAVGLLAAPAAQAFEFQSGGLTGARWRWLPGLVTDGAFAHLRMARGEALGSVPVERMTSSSSHAPAPKVAIAASTMESIAKLRGSIGGRIGL